MPLAGHPAGSGGRACGSWSQGREFRRHTGHGAYLKRKRKKTWVIFNSKQKMVGWYLCCLGLWNRFESLPLAYQ